MRLEWPENTRPEDHPSLTHSDVATDHMTVNYDSRYVT
jgi:hypothetical protein